MLADLVALAVPTGFVLVLMGAVYLMTSDRVWVWWTGKRLQCACRRIQRRQNLTRKDKSKR